MLWAGKSNTFVTVYYNSSSDTIYSTVVQPYGTNWRLSQTAILIGGTFLSPVMSLVGAHLFGWHSFLGQQHVVVPNVAKVEEDISVFLGICRAFGIPWWYM